MRKRNLTFTSLALVLILALVSTLGFAQGTVFDRNVDQTLAKQTPRTFGGNVTVEGELTVEGDANLSTATVSRLVIGSDSLGLIGGGSDVVTYQTGVIAIPGLLPGGNYFVGLSWETADPDPGLTTWVITTDTLTITCATATSGTVHAIVLGR